MNFINRYLLSLLVISFASITNNTFAQDAAEEAIEEVIVTATKRETNLMETPIAVSVVSQEQLNTQGIARISDLSNLIPNMQVGTSAEDSGVNIAIRGIGSNNYTEIGDPTVAVHVDGMYSPRPQAALMLANRRRICEIAIEVAQEEFRLTPTKVEFDNFSEEIQLLSSRVDRLEAHFNSTRRTLKNDSS